MGELRALLSLFSIQGMFCPTFSALSHRGNLSARTLAFSANLHPLEHVHLCARSKCGIAGWYQQRSVRMKPLSRTAMADDSLHKRSGIYIFSDPACPSARNRSLQLASTILKKTRLQDPPSEPTTPSSESSTTDAEEDCSFDAVESFVSFTIPSDSPGTAIFFGEGGRVELLRTGERAGQGLRSELAEVLSNQCRPADLQRDPLIKAIARQKKGLAVVDATAGFGHDALRMAAAGHRVTALERDPVVHAFLSVGLATLIQGDSSDAEIYNERITKAGGSLDIKLMDALEYCQRSEQQAHQADVVYLDPMFPSSKRKSALPKRRMQWLREYLDAADSAQQGGATTDITALVSAATCAASKVVLKRADDGPKIGKPSGSIASSKIVRYDIYAGARPQAQAARVPGTGTNLEPGLGEGRELEG